MKKNIVQYKKTRKGFSKMNQENGFAYQVLVLLIIIVIAIAGVVINKIVGKNGMLNQVAEVETEYSKEDVLEKINHIVTQKFIEINNQAKENNQNISELYNSDVVIEYLKQNLIIEETYDEAGNFQEGIYKINVDKLRGEETAENGTFMLEKKEDKYMVIYYDQQNHIQEVGELQIQQT